MNSDTDKILYNEEDALRLNKALSDNFEGEDLEKAKELTNRLFLRSEELSKKAVDLVVGTVISGLRESQTRYPLEAKEFKLVFTTIMNMMCSSAAMSILSSCIGTTKGDVDMFDHAYITMKAELTNWRETKDAATNTSV